MPTLNTPFGYEDYILAKFNWRETFYPPLICLKVNIFFNTFLLLFYEKVQEVYN